MRPAKVAMLDPVPPRSYLHFDFEGGTYRQNEVYDTLANLMSVSRASQAYADNPDGSYTSFSSNVLRRTSKGLLVEEARTNGVRNNSMQGAVVGTPGTVPTNWQVASVAGYTVNVAAVSSSGLVEYTDFAFSGSSSNTNSDIRADTATAIAALQGQTWTLSFFLALPVGSFPAASFLTLRIYEESSGGSLLTQGVSPDVSAALTGNLARFTLTYTTVNASCAFVRPVITLFVPASTTISFTLRVGWPQLEKGSFATSPIRTTSAAVTRAADVVSLTTVPTFDSRYSASAKATPLAPPSFGSDQVLFHADDGSASNNFELYREATDGSAAVRTTSGATAVVGTSTVPWEQSTSRRAAAAVTGYDQKIVCNGSRASAAGALPVGPLTAAYIGNNGSTGQFNGYIENLILWPSYRLSDPMLARVT